MERKIKIESERKRYMSRARGKIEERERKIKSERERCRAREKDQERERKSDSACEVREKGKKIEREKRIEDEKRSTKKREKTQREEKGTQDATHANFFGCVDDTVVDDGQLQRLCAVNLQHTKAFLRLCGKIGEMRNATILSVNLEALPRAFFSVPFALLKTMGEGRETVRSRHQSRKS